MLLTLAELQTMVLSQKEKIPSLYGDIDFTIVPERFTENLEIPSTLRGKNLRAKVLADKDRVARAKAYTMLGDVVADAYAALIPIYGLPKLIAMLKQACDEGIEVVENPPQELRDFLVAMEKKPKTIDLDLVEDGARTTRLMMALAAPFAIRGAFIGTFMNKYSGLPMAMTGALSSESSANRINETGSFFSSASLPGALQRHGGAFKAAALVRLMHSVVRFNLLKRTKAWDVSTYGIPIPQVDQMPAGMIPAFLLAFAAVRGGRKRFTKSEQGIVELARYQSYLLGLPEDLLPATPQAICDVMNTYSATLRDGYDDNTCGELTRATMNAYRGKDQSLASRLTNEFERSFSLLFFTYAFAGGNKDLLNKMKVTPKVKDYIQAMLVGAYIAPQLMTFFLLSKIPYIKELSDKFLVARIDKQLVQYGRAEYTSDAKNYKVPITG